MKKILSIVLLIAVLVSLCACARQQTQATVATDPATEPSKVPSLKELEAQMEAQEHAYDVDPKETYGHIDQTVPQNGVYQLWNAEGIKSIASHPEGKFQLLCHIDMGGIEIPPIPVFSGELDGVNFTIRNFTVKGNSDGNFGFIGVNKGNIHNLTLENVTFAPTGNVQNVGSFAGVNENTILRCFVNTSAMTVTEAAANASCGGIVGLNTGKLQNNTVTVDMSVSGASPMHVGGIAGSITAGTVEFNDQNGKLVITGENKIAGLIAGNIRNVHIQECAFVGELNTINDKLFENYFGAEENVTFQRLLHRENGREPLPANVQKLRDRVVQEMYDMGSVEWSTSQDLLHDCTCLLTVCHGNYTPGKLHVGIPYNHKGGSMARFYYCVDENNVVKDWVYDLAAFDGFDSYVGNDCSTAVAHAWWTVSNSTDFIRSSYQHPRFETGCIPVGNWVWEKGINPETGAAGYTGGYTEGYILATGEQEMYECYAQMRKGDVYYSVTKDGGHTRMAAADPVVVRDENGLIDPTYSYVLSHEQGAPAVEDPYFCSWRLDYKYTFGQLFRTQKVPLTCEELLTGEMEPVECELLGGAEGKMGMITGTVKSNYFLDSVELVITDSKGNTVMSHRMFATVGHFYDNNSNDNGIRNYNDTFALSDFTAPLQYVQLENGETYSYSVTGYLATGDSFLLKEDSFTQGEA